MLKKIFESDITDGIRMPSRSNRLEASIVSFIKE